MIRGVLERCRPGAAGILMLLALPLLLLIVGLVLYIGLLRDARLESQTGADAAALSAARELATDDLLTWDRGRAQQRIERSRSAALMLGHLNLAAGDRLDLDPNTAHDPDGDIVFGHMDYPGCGQFAVVDADPDSWVGDRINAVQITTRRNSIRVPFGSSSPNREVRARSLAMLDWEVVGFKPFNDLPIPLMPIGVFTDHRGEVKNGWDAQCRRSDRDEWQFDPITHRFVPGHDGIPEVTVVIGRGIDISGPVPAVLLQIGVNSFGDTITQVSAGIARHQLEQKFSSGFVLGTDNILKVPGSLGCPEQGLPTRQLLDNAIGNVIHLGEPRIWPLFSGIDEEDGTALVTGWMAARVVTIAPSHDGGIKLILQPAVVHHPSVVAEHREQGPLFWAQNRTVCRVRLAE